MKRQRSYWKWLIAGASLGLLITNCTIKSATDGTGGAANSCNGPCTTTCTGTCSGSCTEGAKASGCSTCAGNVIGYQVCGADLVYGACVCPASTSEGGATSSNGGSTAIAGSSNSSGGKTGSGGNTSSGGYSGDTIGSAGAGEAGAAPIDPTDCGGCLAQRCAKQWAACEADNELTSQTGEYCLSSTTDDHGQFERIMDCVNGQRLNGVVKRDVVRGCGVTIGASPDPDVISNWAPEGMSPATTDLLNCMGDAPGAMAASWANDDANYPLDAQNMALPVTPWPAGTCAKLACTSQITP